MITLDALREKFHRDYFQGRRESSELLEAEISAGEAPRLQDLVAAEIIGEGVVAVSGLLLVSRAQ